MSIFDGIFGGQGRLTTTTTNTTNPHSGGIQPLSNAGALWHTNAAQQHNTLLNDARMWERNALTPYGEAMELKERVKELEYIVQRVVDNYDELKTQYKALQDITKAGENK